MSNSDSTGKKRKRPEYLRALEELSGLTQLNSPGNGDHLAPARSSDVAREPDLHTEGTKLSERIAEFEARLAALPRKCDHRVTASEHAELKWGIAFERSGSEWSLRYWYEYFERGPYWQEMLGKGLFSDKVPKEQEIALREASLVRKAKAMQLLPQLIEGMSVEYDRRVKAVQEANASLDKIDSLLSQHERKGA